MKLCTEPGCPNPIWDKGKCTNHMSVRRNRKSSFVTCIDCNERHFSRGYCKKHYYHHKNKGEFVSE